MRRGTLSAPAGEADAVQDRRNWIDVHKKMLAVVVADVEGEGDFQFERHKVGTSPAELCALAGWLVERQVDEVVMEWTAQYWRPVWEALELHWRPQRRTRDGASPLAGTLHSHKRSRIAGLSAARGLSGRRPSSEAPGRAGAHPELRPRCRTAPLADRHAPQVPDHAQPRSTPQPAGIAPRGSPHQGLQRGVRSAGHQRTSHAARLS